MSPVSHSRKWIGRAFAGLTGLFAISGIIWLGYTVALDMQILRSARSDNAQWSLAQTEVEFLDFANAVSSLDDPPSAIRRRFDVFYSRIRTIEIAEVYKTLRADPSFAADLADARRFLDETVPLIDAPDETFLDSAALLQQQVEDARLTVRQLSNAGLTIFARNADQQRAAVARTFVQLASALAIFIGALGLAIAYLNKLNITIRRREREQNEIATRMNTVIETSLDGVIVCDNDGSIKEFSKAAQTIFDRKRQEAIGCDFSTLILHADELSSGPPAILHELAGRGRLRMTGQARDGSHFPVEISIEIAKSGREQIFIAFLRDVSNVVAAERDLVAARDRALAGEKLKTDFLTTMSHEIRTPLNGLLGNLSLLLTTDRSARQDRYIKNMETSGRLLMNHISDVLDITRYDAGKLALHIAPVHISVLLQDIIDSQSAMAEAAGTTLHWTWSGPRRDWVNADADRVQLIFMNLIGNAVKFTRNGAITVTVRVVDPDKSDSPLCFQIADTGPGIAPDLIKHVFDDFITGNAAYDREVGGTGLGLSIAKRFVTALGGTITVESELGKGSTFEVILPMEPAREIPDLGPPPNSGSPARALSILLVEDNEINRTVAREMLVASGHVVSEAVDGLEGVAKANDSAFDVILMDISMPRLDGKAAARMIKEGTGLSSNAPIVALTAHASPEDQASFKDAGIFATLTKPLSWDGLTRLLDTIGTPSNGTSVKAVRAQKAAIAALQDRFIAEIDELIGALTRDDLTLAEIAKRAHHAAGSSATFQFESLATALLKLAAGARQADDTLMDQATKDLETRWQSARMSFEPNAAE